MRENLSPIEMKLLESQDLLEVRGKFGRGVPVVIPEDLRKVLKYLTSGEIRSESGMLPSNRYPFLNRANGVIRAYDSQKMLCLEAVLKKPERITSVYLRKYMATVSQIYDLNAHQLQWLSNHLGHSVDIHKIHYRQTSGIIERVDMSKLMLLDEFNLTARYAGKFLRDIQLPELVFAQDKGVEDADIEDTLGTEVDFTTGEEIGAAMLETSPDEDYEPEVARFEGFDEFEFCDEDDIEVSQKRKKAASTRVKWTDEELKEVKKYFKEHLSARTTPGKEDCEKAIKKSQDNKGKIHKRSWETLKKKVWNLIKQQK